MRTEQELHILRADNPDSHEGSTKPENNIHRQQLFHWIGSELDRANRRRKMLSDPLVQRCLDYVRGGLEHGLWVKSPRVPERFGLHGQAFVLDMPIACFTEWSLGESLPHTAEYGRLGFGFPKRWVIECGGQSVTYFRHNEKARFLRCMFTLLRAVGKESAKGKWMPREGSTCLKELEYLLHFAKMIRERKAAPARRRKGAGRAAPGGGEAFERPLRKKLSPAAVDTQTFRRRFGQPLGYVHEREWRIVYHTGNKAFVKGPGTPEYYLPFVPGDELFTLVLPDNKVVSRVLQADWFTRRLFTPWLEYPQLKGRRVPPVMILSHSDLGTF